MSREVREIRISNDIFNIFLDILSQGDFLKYSDEVAIIGYLNTIEDDNTDTDDNIYEFVPKFAVKFFGHEIVIREIDSVNDDYDFVEFVKERWDTYYTSNEGYVGTLTIYAISDDYDHSVHKISVRINEASVYSELLYNKIRSALEEKLLAVVHPL